MLAVVSWYSTVDYVRMSWRPGSIGEEEYSLMWPRLRELASRAAGGAVESEITKMLGYMGVKAGPLFLGRSDQGAILQASGIVAQMVCELGLCPDNVSRLDLQATVWSEEHQEGVARRVADAARDSFAGRRGRSPAIRHIDGYGKGDTAYIGTRGKKSVFIRVYDKWRESAEEVYKGAWRYEAELTDAYALEAYYDGLSAGFGEPMIARLLMGYLGMRGVALSLPDEAQGFDRASIPRSASSRERRLMWLRVQVAPTVQRLILDGEDREYLVSLLGLSD